MRKQPPRQTGVRFSMDDERARRALDEIKNIDDVRQLKWLADCIAQQIKGLKS